MGAQLECKAYTRITLALDIVRRIESGEFRGYHELGIIKRQVSLHDTITVSEAKETAVVSDHPATPTDQTNICWKAVELMRQEFGVRSSACVRIDKNIPVQGGLAGGSADAAATLALLNRLWGLGLPKERLAALGRRLGMDVPYFFVGNAAFDSETGGDCRPIPTRLEFYFVLVVPRAGVSTAEAYNSIDYQSVCKRRDQTAEMERGLRENDAERVIAAVHNDFELSVFPKRPELARIKERLALEGAEAAFMTGSGACLVGLVRDPDAAARIARRFGQAPEVDCVLTCATKDAVFG